jgi:hypothetical protein
MLGLHLHYRRAIGSEVIEHDVAHVQFAFSRHARAQSFSVCVLIRTWEDFASSNSIWMRSNNPIL